MNSKKEAIQRLLDKYTNKTISKKEFERLMVYIKDSGHADDIEAYMASDWNKITKYPLSTERSERLYQNIVKDLRYLKSVEGIKKSYPIKKWVSWSIATAAAISIFVVGAVLYNKTSSQLSSNQAVAKTHSIRAGGNKAMLTLANGEQIPLSEFQKELVISDGSLKYGDGSIIDGSTNGNTKGTDQTIETPMGGTYQIKLADGSKIWLNAGTKLTFSSNFQKQKTRTVTLEGEAYFEVAKDKARPFIVKSDRQTVKVLGTHFNISTYSTESIHSTTLLEGLLSINDKLVHPGQQASVQNDQITIRQVDPLKFAAWKDGKFVFKSESLESIMRKLSRWYDVDVVYKGDFSDKFFTGSISRGDDISKILDKISFTEAANFKIEGRRIIVMQ